MTWPRGAGGVRPKGDAARVQVPAGKGVELMVDARLAQAAGC